jgi:hypothetical protein
MTHEHELQSVGKVEADTEAGTPEAESSVSTLATDVCKTSNIKE